MSKHLCFLVFVAFVGCTNNRTAPEIKNSKQTIEAQRVTFSDENMPIFFHGDNFGGHPSGRTDLANPLPYVLWMQTQTGTKQIFNTPLNKTAYPGSTSNYTQTLYKSVEIGLCPNLTGRCFLKSERWSKSAWGDNRLDQAEACDPALNDQKTF